MTTLLDEITPVILTLNEAPNLERTLAALAWAREVVVVDSFSTDDTVDIARRHANVRIMQRRFDSHASQWNYAIGETGIATAWILALDADYVVSAALVEELRALVPDAPTAAFRIAVEYRVLGRPLRGSVYPPVLALFRRGRAAYRQDGHTQRLVPEGAVAKLSAPIAHDDRKPLARWLSSQNAYMALEAEKLDSARFGALGWPDRVRKLLIVAPVLMFAYALFMKGAILDGRPGLYYALQRTLAEVLLALHLVQRQLKGRRS